ncbi:MAG: hypothetical protein Q9216_003348 [Gyalolechia sp. 2 TL-2023]
MIFSRLNLPWLAILSTLFGTTQVASGIQLDVGSTHCLLTRTDNLESIKNAASTVAHGVMSYYKGNETGMPVGLLPDPYYWWLAGAMFDQMIHYCRHCSLSQGNDDQAFWAFAAMSAAELNFPDPPPDEPSWLSLAQAVFNEQARRWETSTCGGGLRWQIFTWNKGYEYKNSISNGGFFQLAARLARYTGNQTYADWAEKTWEWMEGTVLLTDQYNIYDGANMADNCTQPDPRQWSYNVGTFLAGAANLYNYTDGSPRWRNHLEGLLKGTAVFFPPQYGGNIMQEVACEPYRSCNNDQPSFKAYLSRWMAATTQIAPFTSNYIMPKIRASAQGAAKQCSGPPNGGTTCGRQWNSTTWDGTLGIGEQMSALSIIQANLISKVAPPVTMARGGTSKSNPSAGTGNTDSVRQDPNLTREVTMGDKAGAGILTALVLGGLCGSTWWINLFFQLVISTDVQRRQNVFPSSMSIPAFTYGYYSQLYPNGETTSEMGTNNAPTISVKGAASPTADQSSEHTMAPGNQKDEFVASMCEPVNNTNQPDMNFPCNKIRLYEYSCIYGLGYQELLQNECRRLHGASAENIDDYAPVPYISAFSSAYCAQPSSNPLALFQYATVWTSTALIELGTSTGGLDVLGTSTDVSLYMYAASTTAATSMTPGSSAGISSSSTSASTNPAPASRTESGTEANETDSTGLGVISLTSEMSEKRTGSSSLIKQFFLPSTARHAFLPHTAALFPSGNKACAITTSSYKKRRLSPPYQADSSVSTQSIAVHDSSSPPRLHNQPSSSPSALHEARQATNVTCSPSPPSSIPQHLAIEGSTGGSPPIPELPNTGASSPSAACAHLTIENEDIGEPPGVDTGNLKGRLNSLSTVKARGGPSLSARSSSPAKRLASQMDENSSINPADDVEMEDTLAQDSQHKQLSSSREAVKPPRKNSRNQQSRHKREMSLDPLAGDPIPAEGNLLPDRSRSANSSSTNMSHNIPQSGASTSPSIQRDVTTARPSPGTKSSSLPPIDDQIGQVMEHTNKPLQEGQKGFVISCNWLARVLARGSADDVGTKFAKEAAEGPVGPVDNSGMDMVIDQSMKNLKDEKGHPFIPLRPELSMGDDFEIIPEEAWDLILGWYGLARGSPIITRYCHNTSSSDTTENLQYELRPPIFTIVKIPDTSAGMVKQTLDEKDALPIKILASRHKYFQSFLKEAKQGARINLKRKVRVWRVLSDLSAETPSGMITPAQSRSNSPALNTVTSVTPSKNLVLDISHFAELQLGSERELIEAKDETANENYNGHLSLDTVGLGQDSVVVLEEQIGGPGGGEWVAEAAISKAKSNGIPISITKSGTTKVQNNLRTKANNSRTASPAPGSYRTRAQARKDGRTRGTIGLSNLGNTCYMNSALQCIRSCDELSHKVVDSGILEDHYKRELNPNNPLAHNGMVAKAYASLVREMYGDGNSYAFAPKAFKNVIGKYGPSFSGYGQQDSQEFLLFLLDGLQEDLNRIQKKPYIEKPDSTDDMVNNPVALREMAAKCWDIYKARNDSVITDLFAGMYKSTVVCPVCDKVSIIFDPFNNLTLQLPIENVWSRNFNYIPLHSPAFIIGIDIDKNATFKTLKKELATKTGADVRKLVVAEIYRNKFYKIFRDEDTISEERIQENDILCVFELEDIPTNWPRPKKHVQKRNMLYMNHTVSEDEELPEGDSPQADKMLVVVYHRHTRPGITRSQQQRAIFGVPALIVINREEARDYDAILRKVLANVETLTTRDFLRESDEPYQSPEDSDTVLMNTEEGDSSSESKVQALSVDSEDGMVDISMSDANTDPQANSRIRNPPVKSKSRSRAKILQPGSFITPEVRSLFELSYHATGDTIPASFTHMNEDSKDLPSIASRIPETTATRPQTTASKIQRRLQRIGSASPSDEDDEEMARPAQSFQTETMGSGSDDDDLPPVERLVQPPHQGFSRFSRSTPRTKKGLITYSRQGKHRSNTPSHDETETESGDSPLIKLGEQIYVDWTNEGYEALFGGTPSKHDTEAEMRGVPTWDLLDLRPDPQLDEKRRIRAQRRKNGVSLNDCLDEFGKAEILSENDAWYCPRCKEHRRASKTFELWTAPDILVIHLKRFSSQGRLRDKLDVTVDFPVEGLDLTSRVASQDEGRSPIYDLFAVDNHYGGLGGGHYTAFAKNFFDGKWYEYNDSQVTRRPNPQHVVSSAAYLLFYRRRSNHPLGGPFFEPIMSGTEDATADSQPTSRNASPTGEGKRLDDSSRIGSSSALRGVGAAHQTGGGGDGLTARRTGVDDDLPGYPGQEVDGTHEPTLETMDLDEGIGDIYEPLNHFVPNGLQQSWSFSRVPNGSEQLHVGRAPAASEDGSEENLFDGDSTKAASSPPSEVGDRLADFAEDEGTTSGAFGPTIRSDTPIQVEAPLMNDEDGPVAEVTPPKGEPMFKE